MKRSDAEIEKLISDHMLIAKNAEFRFQWIDRDEVLSKALETLNRCALTFKGNGNFEAFFRQRLHWKLIDLGSCRHTVLLGKEPNRHINYEYKINKHAQ